eukprot:206046-Chlamydomonas_euryale.AAC.2
MLASSQPLNPVSRQHARHPQIFGLLSLVKSYKLQGHFLGVGSGVHTGAWVQEFTPGRGFRGSHRGVGSGVHTRAWVQGFTPGRGFREARARLLAYHPGVCCHCRSSANRRRWPPCRAIRPSGRPPFAHQLNLSLVSPFPPPLRPACDEDPNAAP